MFGMLDYRAHKLFIVLFKLPLYILRLFALFLLPFITYAIGHELNDFRLWQVGISILLIIPVEIVWTLIVKSIDWLVKAIFEILIDIIPHDGRDIFQARQVVWGGPKVILSLKLDQMHPSEWTDEMIEEVTRLDFFGRLFFSSTIRNRSYKIRDYYIENPDVVPDEFNTKQFLQDNGLKAPFVEAVVSSPIYRGWAISYTMLVIYLVTNPIG